MIPQSGINGKMTDYNPGYYRAQAQVIAASRERESLASVTAGAYRLVSHDLATATAVIERIENPDRRYRVNYQTGECECRDYQTYIAPLNRQLERIGQAGALTCKHAAIAWRLAWADAGMEAATEQEQESDHRQESERQVLWGGTE